MADLNKIINELSKLTVVEAADLSKQLEEKWGVSPAVAAVAPVTSSAAPAEEKSEFTIFLTSAGDKKINVINFEKELYTSNIPDPEILIRTGGTKRLSNFLLWQLAYTEIFFTNKLWPDFDEEDFNKIILNYKKIKRNFGKIQ